MRSLWLLLLFLLQNHLQSALCSQGENSRTGDELLEAAGTADERAQRTIEHSPEDTSQSPTRSLNSRLLRKSNFDDFPAPRPQNQRNPDFSLPFSSRFASQLVDYDKSFQNDYELNDEDYQLPRPRKRRPPQHNEYPYANQQPKSPSYYPQQQTKPKQPQMSENSELKALLKMQQYEGLSLSEILQQRNLSLSDLLKGKTEVISALRDPAVNTEDEKTITTTTTTDRKALVTVTTPRSVTASKMEEEPEKPDAADNYPVKIVEMLPTTPKTIKTINDDDEIMEFSDFKRTTNENPQIAAHNLEKFHRDMESILNIKNIQNVFTTTGGYEQTTLSEQRVNFLPKNGERGDYDDFDLEYQNEEPTSVSDFREDELGEQTGESGVETTEVSPVNHRPSRPKIYEEIFSEIEPEARAEILELLNSSATAEKLEDLLRSRNMSLEELIALRQRGNSRLHLAQVKSTKLQNKLRKDQGLLNNDTKTEITENDKLVEQNGDKQPIFNDFSEVNAREDKGPIIIDLSPNKFVKNEENEGKDGGFRDSVELIDLLSEFDSLPFAILKKTGDSQGVIKSAEKVVENYHREVNLFPKTSTISSVLLNSEENGGIGGQNGEKDVKFDEKYVKIDQINEKTDQIDDKMEDIQKNGETSTKSYRTSFEVSKTIEDEEEVKPLSKVRPSIIASGTILGITILGFLLILIVLKIRQKQRYPYGNAFPRTVFQVPVMNTRKLSNSSSNTIMVNVVATSTVKKQSKREMEETNNDIYDYKSDIENDSLDANDSWDTIPDFMK